MQDKVTKCLGLIAQYNPLTVAPGALSKADNCMIRRENIIEDRRGHALYASFSNAPSQLFPYQNRVIIHEGTSLRYDDGSGTFSAYSGSYSAPTSSRIRSADAFSNSYITTSAGIKALTDISGTAAKSAGMPRALDPSYSLTGASGFLANSYQCAYRCLFKRTDANENVVTGYPSQRLWVINAAGGSRNTIITTYLPSSIVAGDVIQFYRTEQASGTATDTAGDEMYLCYQVSVTSTDVSNGYVSFTDSIVDALLGADLYTNATQEGIAQANAVPPLAKDLALYKSNYMLYANTETKQRLYFSLIGTSSLSGKTITLGGVTYNFGASEIISGGGSPQAIVGATGVAAADIDSTARSLVKVINRYASNTSIYAYYLSGPDDLPGLIMVEERGLGASAFTIQASDAAMSAMFSPNPPVSPSTNSASTSTNERRKNAVYYSKNQQPEHVPLTNYLLVGPSNKEILRVVALRESAIVIKEEGVYRITGETPQSFSVIPVDLTVFCKAANSVVALENQVFMLSNQGVVAISESGVQVISHDIEQKITPLLLNTSLASYTSACGYESERSYFLSTISSNDESVASQTLVYNTFTKTWVRHTYAFTCALVESSADKMYLAKPSDEDLYRERKSFTDADFADPEQTITITSIDDDVIEFTASGFTPEEGWVIKQSGSDTEIPIETLTTTSAGYRAELESSAPSDWATGSATLYPSVGMDIEWHPWTGNEPGTLKQVYEAAVLGDDSLNDSSASALTFNFRSNFIPESEEIDIVQPPGGWGASWGSSPWGGSGTPVGYRTYVPLEMQYCSRLTMGVEHKYARQKLVIAGYAVAFNPCGERIGR